MGVAVGTNEITCSFIGLTKILQFFSISIIILPNVNIKEDLHSMSVKVRNNACWNKESF